VTRDIVQPPRWLTMALLFVFWAGIYLPGLGNEELKGEEPRRILPGLSMIRSGDWTHPVVAGESYHRKPPLINWLTAGGVLAFGRIDELAVRLPVTLHVLAFALGLAAAVQRVATPSAGFLAGLFVLTNIGMMEKGRLAEIEGVYVSLTGLAFASWLAFAAPRWNKESPRPLPWLGWPLAGLFLGFAFLAKGPVHLVFFYTVVMAVWWKTRGWKDARHPAHFLSWLIAAAVAAPWFIASGKPSPDGAGESTGPSRWNELTSRLDPSTVDFPSWFLQIFQGWINFLPWIIPLGMLAIPAARKRLGLDEMPRLLAGLLAGAIIGYFLIALTPAARPRFTLPLMGPAAAALALALDAARSPNVVTTPWRGTLCALVWMVGVLAVVLPWVVGAADRPGAVVGSTLAIGFGVLIWEFLRRATSEPVTLLLPTGLIMTALTTLYVSAIQPKKAESEKLRPVALTLKSHLHGDERVILYRASLQPWVFYAWGQVNEVAGGRGLPEKLPGPILVPEERWPSEKERIEKKYGQAAPPIVIHNPWNGKNLLLVRFAENPKE
jgi:4-amino-4-deoxy-L-arabinose transferase-like glycosyltransferase